MFLDVPAAVLQGQKAASEALIGLLDRKRAFQKLSVKEEAELVMLEVATEMYRRGITMGDLDLYQSPALHFRVTNNLILPPLRAVPGISDAMAQDLDEARAKGEFLSQDELLQRTKLNKTALEGMQALGMLRDLPETNQLSFF